MIVKNESAVIERCLASIREVIDYWVICDTGSTDDTPERIHKALEGVPGELHRRPWVDFGTNRTEAITLARNKADYILVLDGDMTASYGKGFKRALSLDSYLIRFTGDLDYRQRLILSGRRTYRYVGAVHEYVETAADERFELLDTLTVTHHGDCGVSSGKPQRYLEMLMASFAKDSKNSRTVFYLAQTLRDLGRVDEALEYYEKRVSMGGGWEEEIFYSLYQIAVLVDRHNDWGTGFQAYVRAWEYRPSRLEPVYHIVHRLRRRREFHTAIVFAHPALSQPYPSNDVLFVHRWMYTYGMPLEYAYCCVELGLYEQAITACDIVRARSDVPERALAEANRLRARAMAEDSGSRAKPRQNWT
ncbi:MAG: glycosyltransferase [Polyangiaceae bacterium]|nr:glycosyltransferase [Polyangiaceae bacterium]